jgi:TonB family protein
MAGRRVGSTAAALLAAAALGGAPPPLSERVLVRCLIAADFTTRDCQTDPDPEHPGAAEAVLAALAAQPLRLPGAPQGERVMVSVLRSELAKPKRTTGRRGAMPYLLVAAAAPASILSRYYPEEAYRMKVEGRTSVSCKLAGDGRLDACWVLDEDPKAMGFGEAALRIVDELRYSPPRVAAPPYDEQSLDVRIRWKLP